MKRERYIHADFDAPPPPKPLAPVSSLFPLRRPMTPDETHDLWADTLEALAHLQRVTWGELRQNKPLGGVADLVPNLSGKSIADLSAGELATLVTRLRVEADRLRVRAPVSG